MFEEPLSSCSPFGKTHWTFPFAKPSVAGNQVGLPRFYIIVLATVELSGSTRFHYPRVQPPLKERQRPSLDDDNP